MQLPEILVCCLGRQDEPQLPAQGLICFGWRGFAIDPSIHMRVTPWLNYLDLSHDRDVYS